MQDKLRRLVIVYFDLMALMVTSTFAYHHTIKKSLEVVPSDTIRFLLAMFISCLFCVVYFAHKGHYSARVPLWQQVRHIIRACGMMLLADLLLNYVAFPTVHGKKWIIISWVMSFQSILLARWVARHFLKKLQLWDVPAVLVGGVNNVSETLFALKSEGYLSYDIKNICLLKSSKTEIEAFREVHPEVEISGQLTDVNPESNNFMSRRFRSLVSA
jgi:FlaA1/EpsC-like NDP-sugar epimerase